MREDHLVEPLFEALREARPRRWRSGPDRRLLWLLVAAGVAGSVTYALLW